MLGEVVEQKMYLSGEDVKNIRDFYDHFEIPMPDHLKTALANFESDQSYANQEALKLATCLAINESTHEVFTDEMFANIRADTASIAFDMSFEQGMQDILTKEDSGESSKD